jgi:hypothetical protein
MKNCFVCKHVKWEDEYNITTGIDILDVFPMYQCRKSNQNINLYLKTNSCEIASTCKDYIEKEISTDMKDKIMNKSNDVPKDTDNKHTPTTSGEIKELLCNADYVAKYILGINSRTLEDLAENGKIPAFQINYGHWIFVKEEIKKWQENFDMKQKEINMKKKEINDLEKQIEKISKEINDLS